MTSRDVGPCGAPVRQACAATFIALLGISPLGAQAAAQSDLLSFYAAAQATVESPPPANRLTVRCAQELPSAENVFGATGWVSFLAPPRESSAWIAAFTTGRIRRPGEALSTTVLFSPFPTAKPNASATLDWGYVWDRNGDGRVDYIAYLQNSLAILPDPLPDSFPTPTRTADGKFEMSTPFLHALIDHAAMVFRHYADDDFDGRVDGAVYEDFDDTRPLFVRRRIVARASGVDGAADQAWAFRRGITDTLEVVTVKTKAWFARGTSLMEAITEIHALCEPGRAPIRRP